MLPCELSTQPCTARVTLHHRPQTLPSCVSPCPLPAVSVFVHCSMGLLRELLHRLLWDCYKWFVFSQFSSPGTATVQRGGGKKMPNLPFGCSWFLDPHGHGMHCVKGRTAASKPVLPCRDLGKCFWVQILKEIKKPNNDRTSASPVKRSSTCPQLWGEHRSYSGWCPAGRKIWQTAVASPLLSPGPGPSSQYKTQARYPRLRIPPRAAQTTRTHVSNQGFTQGPRE